MQTGKLYFFCGKMGSGKTTTSVSLAESKSAVLISEDEWLSALYPEQINTFEDYLQYSTRLKKLVFNHVATILKSGANVVLDFPANTPKQRKWFLDLAESVGADAELLYLKASDEVCLSRLAVRRVEQPERGAFDNEAVFLEVTKLFQEPMEHEGLTIEIREIES